MRSIGFQIALAFGAAIIVLAQAPTPNEETRKLLDRGAAALAAYRYHEAAEAFEKVVALRPDSPHAHAQLARALLGEAPMNPKLMPDKQGFLRRAEAEGRKAVELAPHDPYVLAALATVVTKQVTSTDNFLEPSARSQEATDLWKQVVAVDPRNTQAHAEIAQISLLEIAPAIIMARAKSGVAVGEKRPVADTVIRADLRRKFGPRIEDARRQAEAAIVIDPNSAPGMRALSLAFNLRAQLRDSEADFTADTQASEAWSKKAVSATPHPAPTPPSPAASQGAIAGAMMSQITPPPGVTNMIVALPDAAASQLVKRVEPVYPEEARRAHVQGKVHFRIQIGPDGHVIKIDLVTGDPMLAQAAEQAVRQWVYRPFTADGKADSQAMYAATEVTLEFNL